MLLSNLIGPIKHHEKIIIKIEEFSGDIETIVYDSSKDGNFFDFVEKNRLQRADVNRIEINHNTMILEATT